MTAKPKYKNSYISLPYYSLLLINKDNKTYAIKIDTEDLEAVAKYNWRLQEHHTKKRFYVMSQINGKSTQLHRYITNCPTDLVVDHINRDSLDNRKSNLRCCTILENNNNRSKYANVNTEVGIQGISVLYRVRIAGYKQKYFNTLDRAKAYYYEIMEKKCTDKKN